MLVQKVRPLTFDQKKKTLIDKFGEHLAHGWFDAVAPHINDILTTLGFSNIKRTVNMRNNHLLTEKRMIDEMKRMKLICAA